MKRLRKMLMIISFCLSAGLLLACSSAPTEKAESDQSADKTVKAPESGEPVKITVSKRGYEPKSIEVKKGKPVKLAFFREDEENCGEELVFPKLNIKKDLPVGETVLVEFTPQEEGELGFTCGMDMLRGKVIVSD
ncbi:MAG TPA: cupredoxin domain-containing protein [Pyrinomonadaceae bacterium]|nr:cupredoxin domain-containing protein [Pyrinomonadaceae bacterium]